MSLNHSVLPLYELKAGLFKGLAHPHRIRILELLAAHEEQTVSELQADVGLEASHLSQHLAVLRRHHLVTSERRSSHVHYRLSHPEVADLLAGTRALLVEVLAADGQRLKEVGELLGKDQL